jgi:hypothetical protein
MAATWREQAITLEEFNQASGPLAALCANPSCNGIGLISETVLARSARSSLSRLEDSLRCYCGSRRGAIVRLPASFHALSNERCVYLFHA